MKKVLETNRLLIREFANDDLAYYRQLDSNAEVMRFIGPVRDTLAIEKRFKTIRRNYSKFPGLGFWAVIEKKTNFFIGWVCLKDLDRTTEYEIGYRLLPAYWGKGFATEAATAVLHYGLTDLELKRMVAIAKADNKASIRIIEKLGFQFIKMAQYYKVEVLYYTYDV